MSLLRPCRHAVAGPRSELLPTLLRPADSDEAAASLSGGASSAASDSQGPAPPAAWMRCAFWMHSAGFSNGALKPWVSWLSKNPPESLTPQISKNLGLSDKTYRSCPFIFSRQTFALVFLGLSGITWKVPI